MTSSATSTDGGFRPWHFFVLASLMAATAAVVMSGHPQPANLILISLTIGTAGLAGIGCYRMIAPLALDESPTTPESLGERARAGLEREKKLVLRSIKELEFDRAMGKVSEPDFEEMASRLRVRAIALMKQFDAAGAGYRQIVEQELRVRLGRPGTPPAPVAAVATEPETAPDADLAGEKAQVPAACPACGTTNDDDAKFCKRCGRRMAAS